MRHTVSRCIPNRHAGPLLPPRLSYQSNDTPSGWYSFPVDICPFRCRSSNLFRHLRRHTSLLLPPRICSASVYIHFVPHLRHHYCPPTSSPLTLSSIPIILHLHCASIVILPRLCCISCRIIFHHPVYFATVVCLPSRIEDFPCSASFCTTLVSPL